MNKTLITLLTMASVILSFNAQADTSIVEHYCGKQGAKFKESVTVGSAQRVYVAFGGRIQALGKDKVDEPESLVKAVDSDFEPMQECKDFLLRRYNQDPVARVTFPFDKDQVTDSGKFILDAVAAQRLTYNIVGNTDSVGTDAYNLDLGGSRAHEVAQYLEEKGLPYGSVRVVSLGEANPIAVNTTSEGRALNRRVDITLTE